MRGVLSPIDYHCIDFCQALFVSVQIPDQMPLLWSFPCFSEESDIAYWALPFEDIQGMDLPTYIIYRQCKKQQETVGFWESRHRVQPADFKNLIYSP